MTDGRPGDGLLIASTRVREVATGDVRPASEWQRLIITRDGVGVFDAWATIAAAILARTMCIERRTDA